MQDLDAEVAKQYQSSENLSARISLHKKYSFKLLDDVIRNRPIFRLALCKESIELFLENAVTRGELGSASLVGEAFFFLSRFHESEYE